MNTLPLPKVAGLRHWVACLLVFLLPFVTLLHSSGVSAASLGFFIMSLACAAQSREALVRAWPQVRWVVFAFAAFFAYALAAALLRYDGSLTTVEKPFRMFASVSAMLVVLAFRPDRRSFYLGAALGAFAGAIFVGYQRVALGIERPGGMINPITFGDLCLLLGLVALVAATELRTLGWRLILVLGAVAGLAGLVITGTRGGVLALVAATGLFVHFSTVRQSRFVLILASAVAALAILAYAIPDTGMQARVGQGVVDVRAYRSGENVDTSIGARLELWKTAAILIDEKPWFGRERAAFRERVGTLVAEGTIDPAVLQYDHVHNDVLQKLVIYGVFGLAAWLLVLVVPFAFFRRQLRASAGTRQRGAAAAALAGMVVVASYASFGLTEVIFWSLGGSLFYSVMVFLLMGFCLNAKENDGN